MRLITRFWCLLSELKRDERGHILILFTIMIPVIMGVTGLALDGGRYFTLHNELQDLADAAAIAGARELDGEDGAMDRARDRAQNLLSNDPQWSNVTLAGIQVATVEFPTSLSDSTPVEADADATLIKVTTVTRQVLPTFLHAVGATSADQTSATATAGATLVACNVQPLMLCNPYEPVGDDFHATPGQMFHLKVKGNQTPGGDGNSFAPGDFGLLDPPGYNSSGANLTRNLISSQSPNFCYVNNVSPRTGQAVQKVNDGVNVRFDMPVNGNTTGLDQSPAPNVIKGLMPKNSNQPCNGQYADNTKLSPPPVALPRDSNFTTIGNVQIGDGVLASPNTYWQYHYGANWPSDLLATGQANRYLAYRRELGLDGNTAPTTLAGTETRAPVCQAQNVESTAGRRIISVAVINCLANNVHGNAVTNVRSNKYANFFVTEPSAGGDVYAEFVEMITVDAGANGKLHFIIQLYK